MLMHPIPRDYTQEKTPLQCSYRGNLAFYESGMALQPGHPVFDHFDFIAVRADGIVMNLLGNDVELLNHTVFGS